MVTDANEYMPRHCKPHVGRDQIGGRTGNQTGVDLGLDDHLDLEIGQVESKMDQTVNGSISYTAVLELDVR